MTEIRLLPILVRLLVGGAQALGTTYVTITGWLGLGRGVAMVRLHCRIHLSVMEIGI